MEDGSSGVTAYAGKTCLANPVYSNIASSSAFNWGLEGEDPFPAVNDPEELIAYCADPVLADASYDTPLSRSELAGARAQRPSRTTKDAHAYRSTNPRLTALQQSCATRLARAAPARRCLRQ